MSCNETVLRTLPLLSLLSAEELTSVQPLTELRTFPAQARIVKSGDRASGIYLLLSGRVNVLLEDAEGHRVVVDTLNKDDTFSELALFQSGASPLTFQCHHACEVLFVPRRALEHILQTNCALAIFLARALAQRLERAYAKMSTLAHQDVYGRVMDTVLAHIHDQNGVCLVDIGAEAISEIVAASREMVTRVVNDLIERRMMRRYKRKLVVTDRAALEQWARDRRSSPRGGKSRAAQQQSS